MFDRAQAPFTASASFLMALQPLLVAHSKNAAGGFDYSVPSSVMVSEGLKLVISSALLCSQLVSGMVGRLLHEDAALEFFSYVLPALIYFVNNNCVFFILQAVDPTTFQLLSQMKTIFTGLLFRVFLKRRLTVVQYLALATLACGTACSQLPGPDAACQGGSRHSSLLGLALSVLSALLSALGGIYSEKLLKGRASASIHWQNIQLYVWGVAFNLLGVWLKDAAPLREHGLLAGYDGRAWAVVLCNALNGLAISAVLKYADNIARVYAHAIAMVLTMLAAVQMHGKPLSPQLILAVVMVAASTLQYNLPQRLLHGLDALDTPAASEMAPLTGANKKTNGV